MLYSFRNIYVCVCVCIICKENEFYESNSNSYPTKILENDMSQFSMFGILAWIPSKTSFHSHVIIIAVLKNVCEPPKKTLLKTISYIQTIATESYESHDSFYVIFLAG